MSSWDDDSPLGKFAARRQVTQANGAEPGAGKAASAASAAGNAESGAAPAVEDKRPGITRERAMTVSLAVRTARHVLEKYLPPLWIEGETLSVKQPSSGHLYFVLQDDKTQINAVMWRSDVQKLKFRIEDGQLLRVRGQLTIYEQGGKFQLYVQYAEPAGLGAEALALEQLKRKLAAEGLFDAARKRPLPLLPRRIGVVTSKSGAAVRDIIRTVHRRFPLPILVADTIVQGPSAPRQIVMALRALARTDVDVIIIGRGGGSSADLSAFNDEQVVRAIAECPVPTVSAVGHEVDISLSDLAADVRASTPTAAAEQVVPVLADLAAALRKEEQRLHREMRVRVENARQGLDQLVMSLASRMQVRVHEERHRLTELKARLDSQHPEMRLVSYRAEMQGLEARLHELMRRRLEQGNRELGQLGSRLEAQNPRPRIAASRTELGRLEARLDEVMRRRLETAKRELAELSAGLDSMSPLRVLVRGYAMATADSRVLTDASTVSPDERVQVRLAKGSLDCRVEAVHAEDEPKEGSAWNES